MIKFGKKAISVLLIAMLTITTLVGCAKEKTIKLDETAVLMTVGDTKVTAGMVNFYMRYQQSLMESLYSANQNYNIWAQEVEKGVTYEDTMKEAMLEQLQELYILNEYAQEYKVSLTEDELAAIEKQAEEFEKANSKEAKQKASATKEYATEYMKISMVAKKMKDAMKKDIDTEVSQEEAKQKKMSYVVYEKTQTAEDGTTKELTKKEIEEQKKAAAAFLKGAKANGNLKAYATEQGKEAKEATFGKNTKTLDEKVLEKANKLEENAFSDVINGTDGYYVVQLESLFDSEATDAEVESILEQRGNDRYEELLEKWKKDVKIDVDEKLWKEISFNDLKVNSIKPEVEETENTDGTESTEETDTTDVTETTDTVETAE